MRKAAVLAFAIAAILPSTEIFAKHKTMPCSTMIELVKSKIAVTTYTPEHASRLALQLARAERALALGQMGECRNFAQKALALAG